MSIASPAAIETTIRPPLARYDNAMLDVA